jgi:asparagine N-glycosylation enzyme membrane subunit Stt3
MISKNIIWKMTAIVMLIILFSITLRIDIENNYPKGADTYELYSLSKSIQEKNYIVWNIDMFTALGLTSASYPPGGIIFLSELSLITGINAATIIIFWNFFFIIMCGLLVYLIVKEIFNKSVISILATLIYLNTRFFISYSTFFTARNIIHIFFLAILFILLKKIDFKKVFIICTLIGISFLTHRATILIGIFVAVFIISKFSYKYYKNNLLHNIAIVILTLIIFLSSVFFFGHAAVGTETTKIPFNIGINYIDDILSILFSVSMHFGILIIFAAAGYFFLIKKKHKKEKDFFILISTIFAAGFIVETIYFFYLFLPILAILIAYFLEFIIESNKKYIKNEIIFLIVIGLVLPLFITITEPKSDLIVVRDQTIKLISFLEKENIQKSVACNNHAIYCSHISALGSNMTVLTYTSVRTMMDRIVIQNKTESNTVIWGRIRSKIIVTDNILGTSLFADSYTSAIIRWNTPPSLMKKLVEFTNLGYIIDSNNQDSIVNRINIEKKFKNMDLIYNNGLQQVKVIQ